MKFPTKVSARLTPGSIRRFKQSLNFADRQVQRAANIGLKTGSLYILSESMKIVPVDKGPLRASARATTEGKGVKTVGKVSYGTEYAVFVHENLEVSHGEAYNQKHAVKIAAGELKKKKPQETAKFLEKVIREQPEEIAAVVMDAAQRILR